MLQIPSNVAAELNYPCYWRIFPTFHTYTVIETHIKKNSTKPLTLSSLLANKQIRLILSKANILKQLLPPSQSMCRIWISRVKQVFHINFWIVNYITYSSFFYYYIYFLLNLQILILHPNSLSPQIFCYFCFPKSYPIRHKISSVPTYHPVWL